MSSLEATFDFTGTPKLPKAKAAAIAAAYLNENEQQRAQLYDKMHSISRACVCILAKTHPHISEHCSFIMMLSGCCAPAATHFLSQTSHFHPHRLRQSFVHVTTWRRSVTASQRKLIAYYKQAKKTPVGYVIILTNSVSANGLDAVLRQVISS